MSAPENAERWNVWIDRRLARSLRVYSAVAGVTMRDITEDALKDWMQRNPLSAGAVIASLESWETK